MSSESSDFKVIFTKDACPPAGPYSQAILPTKSGLTPLFVAGQIPADATGALIEGSVADKTRMCCQNLKAIIEAAGGDLSKVVRCGVFLQTMDDFAEMNGEYEKWFPHRPARTCVAVKQLPKGVPVEIDCVAMI